MFLVHRAIINSALLWCVAVAQNALAKVVVVAGGGYLTVRHTTATRARARFKPTPSGFGYGVLLSPPMLCRIHFGKQSTCPTTVLALAKNQNYENTCVQNIFLQISMEDGPLSFISLTLYLCVCPSGFFGTIFIKLVNRVWWIQWIEWEFQLGNHYTATKSWRDYIITAVSLCVCHNKRHLMTY